jgi:hypothetical protein
LKCQHNKPSAVKEARPSLSEKRNQRIAMLLLSMASNPYHGFISFRKLHTGIVGRQEYPILGTGKSGIFPVQF